MRQQGRAAQPFIAAKLYVQQAHEHGGNDGRPKPIVDLVAVDNVRDDIRNQNHNHDRTRDQMSQHEHGPASVQAVDEQQNEYQPDGSADHIAVVAEKAVEW